VIRDGRDVALSILPGSWGPRRIEYAGYYWKWLVLRGMVCGKILGQERYHEIIFEDLLNEPEKIIKSLCHFLDLEYDPVMLKYYKSKEAERYALQGGSKRLGKPINKKMGQKWKRNMSLYYQQSIIRQAGCLLDYFSYEVDKLSAKQQRERKIIDTLLKPESIEQLRHENIPNYPNRHSMRLSLNLSLFSQFRHFATCNYYCWAREGIGWQKIMGGMMR